MESHYPKHMKRPQGGAGQGLPGSPSEPKATGAELLLVWGALAMGLRFFWSLVVSLF